MQTNTCEISSAVIGDNCVVRPVEEIFDREITESCFGANDKLIVQHVLLRLNYHTIRYEMLF